MIDDTNGYIELHVVAVIDSSRPQVREMKVKDSDIGGS